MKQELSKKNFSNPEMIKLLEKINKERTAEEEKLDFLEKKVK